MFLSVELSQKEQWATNFEQKCPTTKKCVIAFASIYLLFVEIMYSLTLPLPSEITTDVCCFGYCRSFRNPSRWIRANQLQHCIWTGSRLPICAFMMSSRWWIGFIPKWKLSNHSSNSGLRSLIIISFFCFILHT